MEILKRIPAILKGDEKQLSVETKKISKNFREAFQGLSTTIEHTHYFDQKLLDNYGYKTTFYSVKKKFKEMHPALYSLIKLVEKNQRVLFLGSNWAWVCFYVAYKIPSLKVYIMEEKSERLPLQQCFSVQREAIEIVGHLKAMTRKYDVLIVCDLQKLSTVDDSVQFDKMIVLKSLKMPQNWEDRMMEEIQNDNLPGWKVYEKRKTVQS